MYIIGKEEVSAVNDVINNGQLFRYGDEENGHLNEVVKFEQEWSKYLKCKYTLSTTSGTASLICALHALRIGPGDEVIIPGYTFIATALAVVAVGAIPVIVDIDESCTIDVQSVQKNISDRTRAIIPVHMMGMPCNMDGLTDIAQRHQLYIVEDACQAVGGHYKGKALGTIGDCGAFSFNYYKIISAGESGAFVSNNYELYKQAFIMHDGSCHLWPQVKDLEEISYCGLNFRNNEINSAILRVQLKRLPDIIRSLNSIKKTLAHEIDQTDIVQIAPNYDLDGDCGVQILLSTVSPEVTDRLIELLSPEVAVESPIYSNRHIYSNWTPIIEKRGAQHPLMDPFKMEANQGANMDYSREMLPTTLEILAKSIMVRCDLNWDKDTLMKKIGFINSVLKDLQG